MTEAGTTVTKLLFIALGGAVGAMARYLVAGWGQNLTAGSFPLGTLIVNLTGCLLIGWLASVLAGPVLIREEFRMALLVGFLGSFTTFSTFGFETGNLLSDGEWVQAAWNLGLSNGLGLVAIFAGMRLATLTHGA